MAKVVILLSVEMFGVAAPGGIEKQTHELYGAQAGDMTPPWLPSMAAFGWRVL